MHAWGDTLKEAFEQCAMAMFGYTTDLDRVQITQVHHVEAEGHDLQSLLFHFLDELLFMFCAEPYLVAKVRPELLKTDKGTRAFANFVVTAITIIFLIPTINAIVINCRTKERRTEFISVEWKTRKRRRE